MKPAAAGPADNRPVMDGGRPVRRRPGMALAALLTVGLVASCGASSPAPTFSPARAADPEVSMTAFELTSTAFPPGGVIPRRFTCDGDNVSPDLAWSGVPDGAGALELVVSDPDAGGFIHWLALDLTPSAEGSLPLGISASPEAPPQGTNDFGRIGWGGPCPPSGTHRYLFTLTAVAAPLALPGAPGGAEVRDALDRATVLGTAVMEGTYARP